MTITVNNSNDPIYTAAFDDLIQEVFKFSFKPWLAKNLWDKRYESYSIIENGKMLANVCIFKTDMLIKGEPVRTHQFGAVATRASERGKGLSRLLMSHVLDKYPDTPAFLGANQSVIKFYPLFGFRPVQTFRPVIDIAINNPADNSIKCGPEDEHVLNAVYTRCMYSSLVDSINTQPVQLCQMLTNPKYKNFIYYLPECETVIIARQEKKVLFLEDVITAKPLSFETLISQLPFSGITKIEFGFNPDWLNIDPQWQILNEPYFIHGKWNLPEYFRFPVMSET